MYTLIVNKLVSFEELPNFVENLVLMHWVVVTFVTKV